MTQTSKNLAVDPATAGGDWLFRQGDLVLGPLPARQLVEKLYNGEVDGRTEVSMLGANGFKPLSDVDYFKLHLAKAEAKLRVDEVAKKDAKKAAKSRVAMVSVVAVLALIVAAGVAGAARYLAVHNPLKADPDVLAELGISIDDGPPRITLARRTDSEELVDYPGAVAQDAVGTGAKRAEKAASLTEKPKPPKSTALASAKGARPGKMSSAGEDPDGMQMAVIDQEAINAVVAKHQKSLYPCLVAEAKKDPGLVAKVPIEFVIGNDGRVAKVWVDNPRFKDGPLSECLLKTLQKWPFKPYEGERATVGLSFNIGKK